MIAKRCHQFDSHARPCFSIAKTAPAADTQVHVCLQVQCRHTHGRLQVLYSKSLWPRGFKSTLCWTKFLKLLVKMQVLSFQVSIRRWISNKAELQNFEALAGIMSFLVTNCLAHIYILQHIAVCLPLGSVIVQCSPCAPHNMCIPASTILPYFESLG